MPGPPKFFVPDADDFEAEWLAMRDHIKRTGGSVTDERIWRIEFDQDGEQLVAQVGQKITGEKPRYTRGRRDDSRPGTKVSHDMFVLAIFSGGPGHPHYVYWSGPPARFQGPYFLATPTSKEHFAE